MIVRWLAALLAIGSTVLAQLIEFSAPASGRSTSLSRGQLAIQWSGDASELHGYRVLLMAGGDSESNSGQVASLDGRQPLSGGETSAFMPVSLGAGPDATNAYYLKMVANRNDGETAAFYSSRFSIAGMTGTFPDSFSGQSSTEVQAAYKQVMADVAAVPQNQAILARQAQAPGAAAPGAAAPAPAPGAAAPPAAAPAGEDQPYSMQTVGDIKYAPMQQQPPTSITAQGTAPLYPTTAYDLARSALALPTFISTVTQPMTYKTSSIVNQATPAPAPADDMAKFLARWKD